jgi:N-acetylglucosamine-6-phosphate deacetylase
MTTLAIENVQVLQPGEGIVADSVVVQDGRIAGVGSSPTPLPAPDVHVDGEGCLLTPGLLDVQTHGIHEFVYEKDPESLLAGLNCLAPYGTTGVLPTLYSCMKRDRLDGVRDLAAVLDRADRVSVPGFHLEGPFLALTGAGADTEPGDVGYLEELLAAAAYRVAAMSISPEVPNIRPVIERLVERGVKPFVTHTRAGVTETQAAVDAGATHATHFYDVFPVPDEREPGVRPVGAVEVFLADPRCTVDFICDGVHVHPIAIQAALAAKGAEGVALITDSNIGAGLPAGVYETPWGYPIQVSPENAARIHDPRHPLNGALAGSALTMDAGIRNLSRWLDVPAAGVWAMGTRTPARILGLTNKGVIAIGADADLVLWDEDLRARRTWIGGRCVFERTE